MIFLLLSFLSTTYVFSFETCPAYSCKLQSQKFVDDTCSFYEAESDRYWLHSCRSDITNYCSPATGKNTTCSLPQAKTKSTLKWPGERCRSTDDCKYNYIGECVENVCQGSPVFGFCSDSHFCEPGAFCNKQRICVKQFPEGVQGCENDYECENGHGCDGGICKKYLSVKINEEVSQCASNSNLLCESSYCFTNSTENKHYCLSYLGKNKKNPVECNTDEECISKVDIISGVSLNPGCHCGINPKGNKFCGILPGDDEYLLYLSQLMMWYRSDEIKKCNTMRRHHPTCILDTWRENEGLKLMYLRETVVKYVDIQANDYCIETMINSEYFELAHKYMHTINKDPHGPLVGQSGAIMIGSVSLMVWMIFN